MNVLNALNEVADRVEQQKQDRDKTIKFWATILATQLVTLGSLDDDKIVKRCLDLAARIYDSKL